MTREFPAPDTRHPLIFPDGSTHTGTVFLKAAIDHPRWEVDDYSYASAIDPPADWASHLAPYLIPISEERLHIGKLCQIADGVCFITASANHRSDGFSTYPFAVFSGFGEGRPSLPAPGAARFPDTVVGHDVWFGQGVKVLPGARIGTGANLGAGAVVSGVVAPYSVVAGNPARALRQRFDQKAVAALLEFAWWDWPIERIVRSEAAICGGNIAALREAAP